MLRILCALALLCLPALAQFDIYTVSHSATLSGASTALVVQLPASGSHVVEVLEATVGCSAACSVKLERNGPANADNGSSILAVTPVALNEETTPTALRTAPNFAAFSGAGILSGTAVTPTWSLPAGAILPFGGGRIMAGSGGGRNYIIRIVGSYTGDVQLFFSVRARR